MWKSLRIGVSAWSHTHCNTWFRLADACLPVIQRAKQIPFEMLNVDWFIHNQRAGSTINNKLISRQQFNPYNWLTMNLILVKFNLKRTSGRKWKSGETKQVEGGKPSPEDRRAEPRSYRDMSIPCKAESNTGRVEIHTTLSWLTGDLIFREIRLFKEKPGYVKQLSLQHIVKLAWINSSGIGHVLAW